MDRSTYQKKYWNFVEVTAHLIFFSKVTFVKSEKINQISKIIHYSLKNQAFQS